MAELDRHVGRTVFGLDPENYAAARPGYPEAVYEILRDHCGLAAGTPTFEVGPGAGTATRRLLELGAAPLTAIEPDPRLAAYLRRSIDNPDLQVVESPFETVDLQSAAYRLGCVATAYHWLDPAPAVAQAARLIAPGGWWVMWWNMFGDPDVGVDGFHEATKALLGGPRSPSAGSVGGPWFAQDRAARTAELVQSGAFLAPEYTEFRWTLVLDAAQVRALYATYSEIAIRPAAEREALLDSLKQIAADEFRGRVERYVVTPVYWSQRL